MAFQIPISSPLTEAQSELTSKISSMKNLLSLNIDVNLNIPKNEQISTFDYLLKIFRTLGIEPELIFNLFLDKVFDQTGTFLEEKVIKAVADSVGQKGIELPNNNNPNATQEEKDAYKEANLSYLVNLVPDTFLQTVKQQLAKNLTIMIFGPKDGASESLNNDPVDRSRLINEAVCGENIFSLSSDPIVKEENVEYNRIALRKQLESGEVIFEVNCQEVKVKLPEEPSYIFEGGGTFTQSSAVPTPSQSLQLLVQHVKTQGQRINNEANSNSIGKSFFEILIIKLLNYMSSLVFPFLGPIFTSFTGTAAAGLTPSDIVTSNCDIMNSVNDSQSQQDEKQEFFKSLANALLKELLRLLLVLAIKEFKKLVANYFAKTALEKAKRKLEAIKQKYEIFNKIGAAAATAEKALRYAAAAAALAAILGEIIE
jgi:hypothetical protein